MSRFIASSCGVLAEVATIDSTISVWGFSAAVGGMVLAIILWWSAVSTLIEQIVGTGNGRAVE